jgi:hypothetical protein
MKPSFNFLDLLPFQLLGGLAIISALAGYAAGGMWLFAGATVAIPLLIIAFKSVPMR